jgi:hypothetical protein
MVRKVDVHPSHTGLGPHIHISGLLLLKNCRGFPYRILLKKRSGTIMIFSFPMPGKNVNHHLVADQAIMVGWDSLTWEFLFSSFLFYG